MVDKVFKAILLFTPIFYFPGVRAYKIELVFFQLASILLFASSLFDTPKREFKIKKPAVLFVGICLFSVIVNGFQIPSVLAINNIFFGLVSIYVLVVYCKDLKSCLNWLMIGLGINTLVFIGQKFGFSPVIDPKTMTGIKGFAWDIVIGQEGGIIGNAPRFAMFIALTLPFVSRLYLIPAVILGCFLHEASVFVSVAAVLIAEADRFGVKWLRCFLLTTVLILPFFFHKTISQSMSSRLPIWSKMITELAQRPFVGFGLGEFKLAEFGMSSFLQWVYGVGYMGIGFIVLCFKKMKWYLIPLVFLCLVEYPFEVPRLWPVIIFTLAYFAIDKKEEVLC